MVQKLENVVIMSLEEYNKIVGEQSLKKELEVELPSNKELVKESIKVGINPEIREELKNLLEMYGQKISNSTLRRLSSSEFVNQITCIWFDEDTWVSSDEMIDPELLVDLDYLKSILEKENTRFSEKFAELKEAHKNGAVIQFTSGGLVWEDCENNNPKWYDNIEYRVKPEEKPQIGDVVKAWHIKEDDFAIGFLQEIDPNSLTSKYKVNHTWLSNAKVVTPQQVQELLFRKDNNG